MLELPKDYDAALLDWLQLRIENHPGCFVLGVCGSQGSGKSTLARKLILALQARGLRCATLSLDDLYLTHAERQQLARSVHPLLATRGVPGTHDVDMGCEVIEAARRLGSGDSLQLPRFDKAQDDRHPTSAWDTQQGPLDLLIFEGWCVGVGAQGPDALHTAVNELERNEDADGRWRRWVNQQLSEHYPKLFGQLDALLYLKIPGWSAVLNWRRQQEAETAAASTSGNNRLMNETQLQRFIQHYQRLTEHALDSLPLRANVVRSIDEAHQVVAQEIRP